MGDYCRRRSYASDAGCSRRRQNMPYLSQCGPLRNSVNKLLSRLNKRLRCFDPRNWTGLGVLIFVPLLLFLFGYFVAVPLLRYFLPDAPWLKSTATLIQEALAKYNADRLARADYALESAGGSVLCSSTTYYSKSGALYSLFGVPLWYHASNPRMVIQPEVQPGTCWAMDGQQGYVTVQLAMSVIVTAVSLEHIPRQLSPLGKLDSAPKEFVILGKEVNPDSQEVVLGKFTYDVNGEPIQMFNIIDPSCAANFVSKKKCGPNTRPYSIISLKVLSNHGNADYTCIYRLRVHGAPFLSSVDYA